MVCTALIAALIAAAPSPALAQRDLPISNRLQSIIDNTSAPQYDYPTALTRDIVPKNFHSHNDYWRELPFYSALSVGAISVEADVWLYNGTLYIGHEPSALTPARTFESLYINPILSVLKGQNPNSSFISNTHNGVYDTTSTQTLYLWVDVKTDGPTTFPAVIKALQPLRAGGWLTTVTAGATNSSAPIVTPGAVTVIGTGNTPLNQVQGVPLPRDYFSDAPIPTLNSTFSNITSDVSPIASVDFASQFQNVRSEGLNETQLALLRAQIATAKSKGIGTRYWDQPGWPVTTRNAIWRQLWNEGVTLLNVDDLQAAANFWEGDTF